MMKWPFLILYIIVALCLGWFLPLNSLQWIVIFLIGFVWYLVGIYYKGKPKFWKLVGRNPDEAYRYFISHPEAWMIIEIDVVKKINKYLRNKHSEQKDVWTGPYRLYIPSIDKVIQIFGKRELYEQEQERVVSLLEVKEREVLIPPTS